MKLTTMRIRLTLAAGGAVLVLLLAVPRGHSQFPRPTPQPGFSGMPNAGISGMPNTGFSGMSNPGISGMPRTNFSGISGMPRAGVSGISGVTGISGISGVSGISGMPSMPMSPGISGISGGFSGFDRAETVWKCSGCQRELGRGTFAPHVKNCPYCNVELTRITDEHGMNRPNPSNFSGYVREQFPNSPAAAPNYNPVTTPTMPMMPPVVNFAPPADDAATEGTTRKVTIIVGSLLGLAMIAGLVVALVGDMKKPAARKKRRPRKKSDDLDW